jgi:hypothetical protein
MTVVTSEDHFERVRRRLVVLGATGLQGSGDVRALLKDGRWALTAGSRIPPI